MKTLPNEAKVELLTAVLDSNKVFFSLLLYWNIFLK